MKASSKLAVEPLVVLPGVAAARLSISVPELVRLLRHYRYTFTELKVGGRPGDRGRPGWGLTDTQIQTIIRGQERVFAVAAPPPVEAPQMSPSSPDGKSRLRRGRLNRG